MISHLSQGETATAHSTRHAPLVRSLAAEEGAPVIALCDADQTASPWPPAAHEVAQVSAASSLLANAASLLSPPLLSLPLPILRRRVCDRMENADVLDGCQIDPLPEAEVWVVRAEAYLVSIKSG